MDLVKGMRYFTDPPFKTSKIYESNKFVSSDLESMSNSKQYQNQTIRFYCFGDCGSKINKFLIDKNKPRNLSVS